MLVCRRFAAVGFALLAFVGAPAHAQSGRPADVAAAFFGALERHDWTKAAALVHPGAVERFRRATLIGLVEWAERDSAEPGLPPGWHRARTGVDSAALRRAAAAPAPVLRGVQTVGDIAALPAPELLVRYLEASFGAFHPDITRRVVGSVVESDSIAHVLFRTRWGPGTREGNPWRVDVLQLQRAGGTWRVLESGLLPGHGLRGLLEQAEQSRHAR